MWSYHLLNYKITVDPAYGLEFLNHMWATEPVGTLSVCLTLTGLLLTLAFKLLDLWWDLQKERARQGKLKIELDVRLPRDDGESPALQVVLSNIGREPIVVRAVGVLQRRWLGSEFLSLEPIDANLPHALNAGGLVQVCLVGSALTIESWLTRFHAKDSLGKLWEAPDSELRKARRQLRQLKTLARSQDEPVLSEQEACSSLI